jgi:[acyl-carrier-protein] S-malonyltransferase
VVECGPGRVLAGLTRRIVPGVESLALTDPATIGEALARLKG